MKVVAIVTIFYWYSDENDNTLRFWNVSGKQNERDTGFDVDKICSIRGSTEDHSSSLPVAGWNSTGRLFAVVSGSIINIWSVSG